MRWVGKVGGVQVYYYKIKELLHVKLIPKDKAYGEDLTFSGIKFH